jgi:hypothetical protein
MRTILLRCSCLLLGLALAGCRTPPVVDAESQARVDRIFAGASSRWDVIQLLHIAPEICMLGTPETQLCEWRLGNRDEAWRRLSEALDTDDRINVICAFSGESSGRQLDSCSAYPRRTNRGHWKTSSESGVAAGEATEQGLGRRAQRELDEARTLPALTRLMGSLPDRCDDSPPDRRICLWRAGGQTYGHGTLVTSIGASGRKRVTLQCVLPADGSPRGRETCTVAVGT